MKKKRSRKKSERTKWYKMMEGPCGILYYCSTRFAAPPFPLEDRLALFDCSDQQNIRSKTHHFLVETSRLAGTLLGSLTLSHR